MSNVDLLDLLQDFTAGEVNTGAALAAIVAAGWNRDRVPLADQGNGGLAVTLAPPPAEQLAFHPPIKCGTCDKELSPILGKLD